MKQQHTATATSILTAKCTYRSLSAQQLFEHIVYCEVYSTFIQAMLLLLSKLLNLVCCQIYGTFSRAMLRIIPSLRGYAEPLTNAMVEFYLSSQERFTQDMQPHYIYSPREMTRWVRGICEAIR
jgi:hypothetical protein